MIFILCNDGTMPGLHLQSFDSLTEAKDWIKSQLIVIEGVGQRTLKMYKIIEGEEITLPDP